MRWQKIQESLRLAVMEGRSIEEVYKSSKEIKSPPVVRLASKQGAVAQSRYND